MKTTIKIKLTIIAILTICVVSVVATASSEDADRLGQDLTPLGGEAAGNEAGTIPAWTGGITTVPSGYSPGDHHPDPYHEDEVLFTIDASNMDEYRDQLSAGHQRMLELYPTFKIPVYPTRRSASSPQYVYDATKLMVNQATLEKGGNGVNNAAIGIPFPIPENGLEVLWNHILRYRGETIVAQWKSAAPTSGGQYSLVNDDVKVLFRYSQQGMTPSKLGNTMILYKHETTTPPYSGEMVLVYETINQKRKPRSAWTYSPDTRRVRRAPNMAYDHTPQRVDGLRTVDQLDMYNGAPDRYDWKLIGKREMYVPYNSYKLHSDQLSYSDILAPKHLNPDHLRYELHRVWVVEGTRKEGASHIYKRRTFYIDEDSWNILLVDIYDENDELWRVQEGHVINYYEAQVFMPTLEVYLDLNLERYLALGLDNEDSMSVFNSPLSPNEFTRSALRREGR